MSKFQHFRQQQLAKWLSKRIPKQAKHCLNRKNIFILPNGAGYGFLACWLAVYLLATNYQNNLMLLFVYWLLAIFLLVMLLSFLNLYGFNVSCDDPLVAKPLNSSQIIYLGQKASLMLQMKSEKNRFDLTWLDENNSYSQQIGPHDKYVQLTWYPHRRGLYEFPRFKLSSTAPMGWFYVWSYLHFSAKIWVCAQPIACPQYLQGTKQTRQGQSLTFADEFSHLSNYQMGDVTTRIAWKKLLPERPLQVKRFVGTQKEHVKYSIKDLTGDIEHKLGCLAWLVMQAHQNDWLYQLELPQQKFVSNRTEQQYLLMLQAIALVGNENA